MPIEGIDNCFFYGGIVMYITIITLLTSASFALLLLFCSGSVLIESYRTPALCSSEKEVRHE